MGAHTISQKAAQRDAQSIFDSIRRLVRGLRLFSEQTRKQLDLSAAQLFVLQQLETAKSASMKDLARISFTDQSSISAVVSRLAEKGLLNKRNSKLDHRNLELRISAKGRKLLQGQPDSFQAKLACVLMDMDGQRRSALKQDLERLVQGAGLAQERPELFFTNKAD